ncbi:hypothetical protein GEU84_000350 [Fertoebacter nigrum]|uniref:Uncharacterized protein n=1 Tax=Fertoeibacter niger TaxID=2656921 RepID=A0A8X8GWQ9_9RHOB|nr:hypothetical protein [Fertoeibacter niger]NUB42821.1 hypothetical protein [Fertoeibacter niger]
MLENIAWVSLVFSVVTFVIFLFLLLDEWNNAKEAIQPPEGKALIDSVDPGKLAELLKALKDLGPKALALAASIIFMWLAITAATPPDCPKDMTCTPKAAAAAA